MGIEDLCLLGVATVILLGGTDVVVELIKVQTRELLSGTRRLGTATVGGDGEGVSRGGGVGSRFGRWLTTAFPRGSGSSSGGGLICVDVGRRCRRQDRRMRC